MAENKPITAQQLRDLQYKRENFKLFTEFEAWRDSKSGGGKLNSKPIIAFFQDQLREYLGDLVVYINLAKELEEQVKINIDVSKKLKDTADELTKIKATLRNMMNPVRQLDAPSRFKD